MYQLKNEYEVSGVSLSEFEKACREIDEATSFKNLDTSDISLLTLVPEKCDEKRLVFYQHTPNKMEVTLRFLERSKLAEKHVPDEVINELMDNKLMICDGENTYFTGSKLISTFAARTGLSGSRLAIPSFARNAYFSEIFGKSPIPAKILIRTDGSCKKIFALHSNKYGVVRQTIIPEVIMGIEHGLGEPEVIKWQISQDITSIVIAFPQKAEDVAATYKLPDGLTPVLYLGTSDTGDSAITALGGWMTPGGTISYEHVYKRVHKAAYCKDSKNAFNIEAKTLLENIDKSIFAEYRRLPERLFELMSIEIDDVEYAYKSVMKSTGLRKALGQKKTNSLLEQLSWELSPGYKYTAYNVAMTFLGLPDRLKGHIQEIDLELKKMCGQAPYANYRLLAQRKKEEEEELILTA